MTSNTPIKRFQEFKEPWVHVRLREFTKINQGLQIAISERLTEPTVDSFFYITNEFLKNGSTKKYYIQNPPKSVICSEDDVLMTRTGNTGQVVTNVSGAFHNNFFKIQFDQKKVTKKYLVYFLRLPYTQYTILKLAGTSTIPDLNHSDFYRIFAPLPSLPEQQKIASFLSSVDERIELMEQKKEKLEVYKKGVMQQIFTQQIRFKQEDGSAFPDWEEKKLREVATFSKGKGISKNDIDPNGNMECVRYGELYTEYKEVIDCVKSRTSVNPAGLVLSKANDVLIPSSGETQIDIARATCVIKSGVVLGGDLNIIRSNLNGVFLSFYLNHRRKYQIAKMAQGISVVHLYNSQLEELEIEIPCNEEQEKVVAFLNSIDENLETLNSQLQGIRTWKKGLLQQMFV